MQVYEYEKQELEMKRDMDLVRELLLRIEEDPRFNGSEWLPVAGITGHSPEEVAGHISILVDAGYLRASVGGSTPMVSRLTWDGHEFLDDIKDAGVWESTKARIAGLPGVALAVIAEIAKAEIKKKLGLP
jgi:hypothetical protein